MVVTAYATAFGWIGLAMMMAAIVLAVLGLDWHIGRLFWISLGVMVPALAVAGAAGWSLRCAACRRRLFQETFEPKHPQADALPGLMHWATAIIRVLQRKPVICMYCGTANPTR